MSIEKIVIVDRIEVVGNAVQVRTKTIISEDGAIVGDSLHRHVLNPGDDYSNEDARVHAICAIVHTPEVIEAHKAESAAQGV